MASKQEKAKRRAKRKQKQAKAPVSHERRSAKLIAEFHSAHPGGLSDLEKDVVSTILDFQHNYIDFDDPLLIEPEDYDFIVTELLVGKVLAEQEYFDAAARIVRPLADFIGARAKPAWAKSELAWVRTRMSAFAGLVTDPQYRRSKQSMGGRIATLAQDEGVDLSDPDAIGAFVDRYNAMPQEWRERLTDAEGSVSDATVAGPEDDESFDDPFVDEVDEFGVTDPVEFAEMISAVLGVPEPRNALAEIPRQPADAIGTPQDVPVPIRRIAQLLQWVRTGPKNRREVTGTDAIKMREVVEVAELIGCDVELDWRPRPQLDDVPTLALLWRYLINHDILVHDTKATVRVDEDAAAPFSGLEDAAGQGDGFATIGAHLMLEGLTMGLGPLLERALPALLSDEGADEARVSAGIDLDDYSPEDLQIAVEMVALSQAIMSVLRGILHALLEHGRLRLLDIAEQSMPLTVTDIYVGFVLNRWVGIGLLEGLDRTYVLRAEAEDAVRLYLQGRMDD